MQQSKREHRHMDMISQLPNEILVDILSFLALKEAARTSVLSKRWRNLWVFFVRLDFDASKTLDSIARINHHVRHHLVLRKERRKYVKWVNKVVESRQIMALDTFKICFDLDKAFQGEIDKWVQYAFASRVQRLELNLLKHSKKSCYHSWEAYPFPHDLLGLIRGKSSESVSGYCGKGIHSCELYDFKSLMALTFRWVDVSGEVLEFFLHNCPLLEHLVVDNSRHLRNKFEVCGTSLALKNLEISNCLFLNTIAVHDTNIVSLKITDAKKLVIKNVPMLVKVWISGRLKGSSITGVISRLSHCLQQLEVLTLEQIYWDVRLEKTNNLALPELIKLKQLVLVGEAVEDDSLIASTYLIRAAPNLEKFVLKLEWPRQLGRGRGGRGSKKAISFPHHHLKVVEFLGYYGRATEVELVEYLLENALVLERIIIDPRDQPMSGRRRHEAEREESARSHAKQQLKGLMPSHVELVLL